METLLCIALEQWFNATAPKDSLALPSLMSLAGKYEGDSWDELLAEIERNRQQEATPTGEGNSGDGIILYTT